MFNDGYEVHTVSIFRVEASNQREENRANSDWKAVQKRAYRELIGKSGMVTGGDPGYFRICERGQMGGTGIPESN
jgi:hypothetical protein